MPVTSTAGGIGGAGAGFTAARAGRAAAGFAAGAGAEPGGGPPGIGGSPGRPSSAGPFRVSDREATCTAPLGFDAGGFAGAGCDGAAATAIVGMNGFSWSMGVRASALSTGFGAAGAAG